MSVNVSGLQFMSAGFAAMVGEVLDGSSLDPRLLTLDLPESVFVRDGERALVVLRGPQGTWACEIALDDFGTSPTSLSYLMEDAVDTVKLDRTFVAKLGDRPGEPHDRHGGDCSWPTGSG